MPRPARYRLRLEGRGRASRSRSTATRCSRARATRSPRPRTIGLARGPCALDVRFEQPGPGPRLRLGWTRPDGRTRDRARARISGRRGPAWVWRLDRRCSPWPSPRSPALVAWLAPWDVPRRPPAAAPVRCAASSALAGAGYAALLVVMSWPLVARPRAHRADGPPRRPAQRVDPGLGRATRSGPRRRTLFQAPNFHPLPDALAFSENLLLPGARASRPCSGSPAPSSPTTSRSSAACCSRASARTSSCAA